MKYVSSLFVYLGFAVIGNVQAANFDYCYSNEKGLDQACLARKNDETSYHNNRRYERERSTYIEPAPAQYDSNGRFTPTPIPQRPTYVLPGMP